MLVANHVPPESLPPALPVAVGVFVLGVGFAVLGARLARPVVVILFAIVGSLIGARIGYDYQHPVPLTAVLGATALGSLAFVTFRLWVGVLAGLVLSSIALGAFGSRNIWPHLLEYDRQVAAGVIGAVPADFSIPDAGQAASRGCERMQAYASDFWEYLRQRDADVERNVGMVGIAAGICGLMLGLLAVRFTVVVFSALVGTSLVTTGLTVLGTTWAPNVHQAVTADPRIALAVVGGVFLGSVVIQTLLTRKPAPPTPTPAG